MTASRRRSDYSYGISGIRLAGHLGGGASIHCSLYTENRGAGYLRYFCSSASLDLKLYNFGVVSAL
jgi:hypothetical protein